MSFVYKCFLSTLVVLQLAPSVFGQLDSDTILLQTHIVNASKTGEYNSGAQKEVLDKRLLSTFENRSLGEALLENTLISIKSYGSAGSLSSASIRGLSSNHVQVNWNGIPLNSLTTGDFNIGLVPAGAFDAASFTPNASGSLYGSGTMGGAIDLETGSGAKENSAMFSAESSTLNSISSLYKVKLSKKKLQTSVTAWFQNWKNDYLYNNDTQRRKNAEYVTNAFILNNQYLISNSRRLQFGLWMQEVQKNLPAVNGTNPDNLEFQNEENLRTYLSYNARSSVGLVSASAAYINDFMHYGIRKSAHSSENSFNSLIRSESFQSNVDYQYYAIDRFKFFGGMRYRYATPTSNNYADDIHENQLAFYASGKYSYQGIVLSSSARKEFHTNFEDPLLFGVGGEYSRPELYSKLNFSINQKFRIATFNERFWQNIGNPNLEPEKGISYEAGYTLLPLNKIAKSSFILTYYYNSIEGLIRWLPINGMLQPHVYSHAKTRGLEIKYKNSIDLSPNLRLDNQTQLGINKSTQRAADDLEVNEDLQLPYTPQYKFVHTSYLNYKNASLRFNYNYIGQQHYDETEWWLPSIHVFNLSLSYLATIQGFLTKWEVSADNLSDKNHEYMKAYPSAGRIYRIKLNINI